MDETVTPANASWLLKDNGVPRAVASQDWLSGTQLRLTSVPGALGTNPVTIELLVVDSNLRSFPGTQANVFGPETLQPV